MLQPYRRPFVQRGRGFGLQRGRGLSSFLGGVWRNALPALKFLGKKVISSQVVRDVGSSLRQTAAQGARNIAVDVLEGRGIKNTWNSELKKARQGVAKAIEGSGRDGQKAAASVAAAASADPPKRRPSQRAPRRVAVAARRPARRRRPPARKSLFYDEDDGEDSFDDDDTGTGDDYRAAGGD
jgi:hypothetical protein